MPDLSQDQIDQFASRLRGQRDLVLGAIRQRLHGGESPEQLALANHFAGVLEQCQADLQADTDIGLLQLELADLDAIDNALRRVGTGTYGLCARCGQHISLGRLRAQPAAHACLRCQEALEKYR